MQNPRIPGRSNPLIDTPPRRDNTVGIVVTYNPNHSIEDRIAALAGQVSEFVVVDNGSATDILHFICIVVARLSGHVISNPGNRGVATALNQGVAWASLRGHKWALLLDQDTQIDERLVEALGTLNNHYPERESLAIVAANFIDPTTRETVVKPAGPLGREWISSTSAITSGSLISLSAYRSIGPFRDEFFIDHVDTEYCLRAKKRGFKVIVSTTPLMIHSIGAGSVRNICGARFWTSNHSPLRRYYNTRNGIVLAKEYLRSELSFVIYLIWSLLKSIILLIVFEADRLTKLRHVLIGLVHGIAGRLGPFEGARY